MAWHYFRDGITQGPVALTELQRLHQQGVVAGETPVWTEGMADWAPYQQSAAAAVVPIPVATGGSVAVPGSGPTQTCVECGKLFPEDEMLQYEGRWVCALCKPIFFQRLKEGLSAPGILQYASIGRRFLAMFIDGILIDIVVFAPIIILTGLAGLTANGRSTIPTAESAGILIFQYLAPALYEIIMIGRFGATLGKMAMGVKVVSPDGQPISYGRSTGRYFGKMLSGIILGIGYLMAFWDPEKRALHDRICHTRVISVRQP